MSAPAPPFPRRGRLTAAARRLLAVGLAFALGLTGAALAQTPDPAPASDPPAGDVLASGTDPEATADAAVQAWLEREPVDLTTIVSLPPEEVCAALPGLLRSPPPQEGTTVNLDDRRELDDDDPDRRRYTYSAVRPPEQLEVVEVQLERRGDLWFATDVGYRVPTGGGGRAWLQRPLFGWLFVAFTVAVVALLIRPSFLRRWLASGAAVVREHRGIVIGTMAFLYGVFALGAFTGSQLPGECGDAILELVEVAVTSVGATEAYASGNLARAAVVTFYQNFVVVTLSVTFSLALLFGVPAYLLASLSFFVQAIPFGLLGSATPVELVFVLILLGLELTAYFLVVAGGGILLATLIRKGFRGLQSAFTRLALMLPIAMLLLLIGAWYEALVLIAL